MNRKIIFLGALAVTLLSVQSFGQMPEYVELYKYLINLPGWKAVEPTGMNMSGPMGEMVTAQREYKNGTKALTAQILSGTQAQGVWAPFTTGMTFDTPDAFMKVTEIKGYHIGISHDKKENSGGIVVPLKDVKSKVFVTFVLSYEGMSYQDALTIAEKFPWKEMEKAFK